MPGLQFVSRLPHAGSMNEHDVTRLLIAAREGRDWAFDELMPLVYDELRDIARQRLRRHRPGETLNTTALVHEAYIRLVDQSRAEWQDRAHFFAFASRAMRFILVDYARARCAQKRGGGRSDVPLDDVQVAAEQRAEDILALDEALQHLAEMDERLSKVVHYRFFGGLTYEEIAERLGTSVPTAKRDWRRARAWLYQSLQQNRASS